MNLNTIGKCQLHRSQAHRIRSRWEEIVCCAMKIVGSQTILAIKEHMLIAQAQLCCAIFIKVGSIFGKGSIGVLFYIVVGIGNSTLINTVGVVALNKSYLASCLQLSLPQWIRKHQFASKKATISARFTQHKIIIN